MGRFEITAHVQGATVTVAGREDGNGWAVTGPFGERTLHGSRRAVEIALEAIRRFLARQLHDPRSQRWGVRLSVDCGNFAFGDWSFAPPVPGAPFPEDDPIYRLYLRWQDRAQRDPHVALAATRELIEYCLDN